jgi:hypothetical protein
MPRKLAGAVLAAGMSGGYKPGAVSRRTRKFPKDNLPQRII